MRYSWWVFCQKNSPFVKFPLTFSPKTIQIPQNFNKYRRGFQITPHKICIPTRKAKTYRSLSEQVQRLSKAHQNESTQTKRKERRRRNKLCFVFADAVGWTDLALAPSNWYAPNPNVYPKKLSNLHLIPTNAKGLSLLRWVLACETRMWGEMNLLGLLSLLLYSNGHVVSGRRTSGQCS